MTMKRARPVVYRVLIEPIKVEETSKGGIVLVTPELKKLEQQAQVRGKVLSIGPDAYADMLDKSVKVGDIVFYQRHSGMRLTDHFGNIRLDRLLLNDKDIVAVEEELDDN